MGLIFKTQDRVIWNYESSSKLNDPLIITIKRDNPSAWMRLLIILKLRKAKISFPVIPPKMRLALKLTELLQHIAVIPPNDNLNQWGHEMRQRNYRKIAEFIATYIYNRPKRATPADLTDFIMDNVEEQSLVHIMESISKQMDITSLVQAIGAVRSLDIVSPTLQQEDEVQSEV